jgi:glycosyltransferase involved in cell wall biosynthesis
MAMFDTHCVSPEDTPGALPGLRVLSIAPTSFFGDYGCHVRILEEASALKALGHEVTILTYYKGADVPGFRIIRTGPTPWHGDYDVGSSRHKFAFDILLGVRLLRVLTRNSFDIIHAHLHEGALMGSVLSKPWGIPVCFDYQGSLTSEMLDHGFLRRDTRLLWFWQQAEKLIEQMPSAIFTSTINACDALHDRVPPSMLLQALPDGVKTDVFRPDVLTTEERSLYRNTFGIRANEPVVVFLGLLAKQQGISCLIEAAALLKAQGRHMRWLVMGYPGVAEWQRVAALQGVGEEMIFTGRIPYGNAPQMLALGDIAIAPKLSRTEGSGKILNYMAMGLPIVAFETLAQTEYLGDLGVYAPVGDVAQLAQRVAELIDQPDRRAELGQRLRARVQQLYSWDHAAQVIDKVYRSLLVRRPKAAALMNSDTSALH